MPIIWLAVFMGVCTAFGLTFGLKNKVEENVRLDVVNEQYISDGFVNPETYQESPEARKQVRAYIESHGEWQTVYTNLPAEQMKRFDEEGFTVLAQSANKALVHAAVIDECGAKALANRCTYILILRTYNRLVAHEEAVRNSLQLPPPPLTPH